MAESKLPQRVIDSIPCYSIAKVCYLLCFVSHSSNKHLSATKELFYVWCYCPSTNGAAIIMKAIVNTNGAATIMKLRSLRTCLPGLPHRTQEKLASNKATDKASPLPACVVCLDRTKNVVLLPCRHMCLCDACGVPSNAITHCPLCRVRILSRISVYA